MTDTTVKPQVEVIAASDSAACSGIQADNTTIQNLGAHALNAMTAVTAQNPETVLGVNAIAGEALQQQLQALSAIPVQARKIGLIASTEQLSVIQAHLKARPVFTVLDPVMLSSTGKTLGLRPESLKTLLDQVDLVTPNIPEAEALTGREIHTLEDRVEATRALRALGPAVYLKGGHGQDPDRCLDLFWAREKDQPVWLAYRKQDRVTHTRGTGCTLSSAIAAAVAGGYELPDALCVAGARVQWGLGHGYSLDGRSAGPIARQAPEPVFEHYPRWLDAPDWLDLPPFPDCGPEPLGLYPVIDSLEWLDRMVRAGVTTCQLRIKHLEGEALRQTIQSAVARVKGTACRLFINDYWELAAEFGAYGVHLGQEDLDTTPLEKLAASGLRLGISTHGEAEWCRAAALRPSYLAIGAIFPTQTKPVQVVGLEALQRWQSILGPQFPLTAIGGIGFDNLPDVLATGIDSIAVVSAITRAADPEQAVRDFQQRIAERA